MTAGDLDGLVAVVTGGAAGIGRETACALAAQGATVCVFDISVNGLPDGLRYYPVDVSIRASIDVAVEALTTQFGRLDILVNNAGIAAVGTVEENDDDEWARVLDINVTGMARVTAAALPWLRRSPHAAIVNVGSIAVLNGLPRRALYSASKGAVVALTYAMATDHVGEGIRVNAVSPGTVATEFVDRLLQTFDDPVAERAAMDARQAIGRMVTPREVADAIVFLASPRSSATTGTVLEVDGGVTHLRVRH
jgi:NAD(P)-dependent dehydrogenase (short-subunit alcohol dehydrogenase family)